MGQAPAALSELPLKRVEFRLDERNSTRPDIPTAIAVGLAQSVIKISLGDWK